MKRFTLLLSAMLLACATNLWAADPQTAEFSWEGCSTDVKNATWSVSDKDITLTFDKGTNQSTPSPNKEGAVRMYTGTTLTISATEGCMITKVEFTHTTSSYPASNLQYEGKNLTLTNNVWTLVTPANPIKLTASNNARFKKIVVTYTPATSATLQSIQIAGEPTKTTYMAGDAFSTDGLKVMGTYEGDDTPKEITEGITWEVTPNTLTAGLTEVEVKATVGDKSTTRTITGLTVTAPKTLTSIAVSGTPAEFWKGDTFHHDGMTVTATWDDASTTDVTAEATFSEPDMATAGVKTITVTYKEKTTTYDITIKTIANTQETAYTVAEAIALIDAGKDLSTEVFVKGIVSEIVSAWSEQYKNITYNISDDGTTTSAQFQLFRCLTNGAGVGDKVVAKGVMKKYDPTYEFDAKNTIVAIVPKTVTSIAISGEATTTNYYAGQTFDPAGLVVTATFDDESTADVTALVDWAFDPAVLEEGMTTVSVSATYKEVNAAPVVVTVTVGPAPKIVTIDLTTDETTTATVDKLEWAGTVLTITAAKGEATTNANNYYGGDSNKRTSTRFYQSSTLTFTPAKGITLETITYKATTDAFATAMANSTWANATASADGTTVTITPKDGASAVSATISATTGGTSFVINYSGEASATALDNAIVETPAVKTIENGQLVILRDGVKYNAMGVRLQ